MVSTEKIVIHPDWRQLLRAHQLDQWPAVWALATGTLVKRAPNAEIRRIELADGAGHRVLFVKKYNSAKPKQLWSGALRGTLLGKSKVRREFDNLNRLRQWGLDAPAPIAYGEARRGGWLVRSFLVSEGVADPVPLDALIRDHLPGQSAQRRELLMRLADYVRRVHEQHFVHGDLYWRNIILTRGTLTRFALIDAQKGHCWRARAELRSRAQDLATLDAPAPGFFRRSERLRFFLRYVNQPALTDDGKRLVRLTLQLAEPMRAPQLRRVREGHR